LNQSLGITVVHRHPRPHYHCLPVCDRVGMLVDRKITVDTLDKR
jgi:hypothetical protein